MSANGLRKVSGKWLATITDVVQRKCVQKQLDLKVQNIHSTLEGWVDLEDDGPAWKLFFEDVDQLITLVRSNQQPGHLGYLIEEILDHFLTELHKKVGSRILTYEDSGVLSPGLKIQLHEHISSSFLDNILQALLSSKVSRAMDPGKDLPTTFVKELVEFLTNGLESKANHISQTPGRVLYRKRDFKCELALQVVRVECTRQANTHKNNRARFFSGSVPTVPSNRHPGRSAVSRPSQLPSDFPRATNYLNVLNNHFQTLSI